MNFRLASEKLCKFMCRWRRANYFRSFLFIEGLGVTKPAVVTKVNCIGKKMSYYKFMFLAVRKMFVRTEQGPAGGSELWAKRHGFDFGFVTY